MNEKGLAHLAILLRHVVEAIVEAAADYPGGRSWRRRRALASHEEEEEAWRGGRRHNSGVRRRQADRWIGIDVDVAEVVRRRPRCCGLVRASHEAEAAATCREEEVVVSSSREGVARGGEGFARRSHECRLSRG
jgi:hypothetical protein